MIVTGAGDKALCTGVDITDVSAKGGFDRDELRAEKPRFLSMTSVQSRCWKPVITAVNGMVCGGGLHFIADSDLIVCAEHATFFDTHVHLGVISGLEPVALALGPVGEVVPQAALMPRARELAREIAAHSPIALTRSKQAIWESLDVGLDEAMKRTWNLIRVDTRHPDHSEGPRARMEAREPKWAPYLGG